MKQKTVGTLICSTQWDARTVFYVAQVKGDGGADWGYTTDPAKAIPLNKHFAKLFKADTKFCGRTANVREMFPVIPTSQRVLQS